MEFMEREANLQPLTEDAEGTPQATRGLRWGRLLAWGGLILLLAIVGMGLARVQQGPVSVGQTAPTFTLTTFDGEQIDTKALQGKVIVVNFWASWCKPCEQEAADLEAAWRQYQPRGDVVFVGVDWTDTETKALAYLDRFGITYPNGPDLGTRISQVYRITGVPETYFIGPDGKLAYFKKGPFTSLSQIQRVIDSILEN